MLFLRKVALSKPILCDLSSVQKANSHMFFKGYCFETAVLSDVQYWNYFCKLQYNKFQSYLFNILLVSSFCLSLLTRYGISKLEFRFVKPCMYIYIKHISLIMHHFVVFTQRQVLLFKIGKQTIFTC